jgi:GR25 family glycosyltransferase involved in LPS biosynthesis
MDVFIIHVPTHVERHHHMEKQMKAVGITHHRYVTPVQPTEADRVGVTIPRGVQSLYETNIALLEWAAASSTLSPYLLVFEDDVVPNIPPERVLPTLHRALRELPNDWQMLYLEYCYESCLLTRVVRPGILKARSPLCTAAILYRRSALPTLIPLLCAHRNEKAIDLVYRDAIQRGQIQAYSLYPPLFRQDTESFSSTLVPFYMERIFLGYCPCITVNILKIILVIIVVLCIGILYVSYVYT